MYVVFGYFSNLLSTDTAYIIFVTDQKKFPGNFYSALAGFMEPGESFEDAVKREMWEEAGVKVWNIRYHSGQPWVRVFNYPTMRLTTDQQCRVIPALPSKPNGGLLRNS